MSEQHKNGKEEQPQLPGPDNPWFSLDFVEEGKKDPDEFIGRLVAENGRNQGVRRPVTAERPFPFALPPPLRRRSGQASSSPPKEVESTPKKQQKRQSDLGLEDDSDDSEYLTSATKRSPFGGTPIRNPKRPVTRSQKGKSSIGSEPTNASKGLPPAAHRNENDEDDESEDEDNDNTASPSACKGKERLVETGGKKSKKTSAAQSVEDVVLNNNTPSYCGTSTIPNDILKLCKDVRKVLGGSTEFTREARLALGGNDFSSEFNGGGFIISKYGSPSRLWYYWMDDRLFQAQDWRNLATNTEKPYPKELIQAGTRARAYSASIDRSNPYPGAKIRADSTSRTPTPNGDWTSPFLANIAQQISSDTGQKAPDVDVTDSPGQFEEDNSDLALAIQESLKPPVVDKESHSGDMNGEDIDVGPSTRGANDRGPSSLDNEDWKLAQMMAAEDDENASGDEELRTVKQQSMMDSAALSQSTSRASATGSHAAGSSRREKSISRESIGQADDANDEAAGNLNMEDIPLREDEFDSDKEEFDESDVDEENGDEEKENEEKGSKS